MRCSFFLTFFIVILGCNVLKSQQIATNVVQYVPPPGMYEITFKATSGPKENSVTKGILWLFQVDKSMRSSYRLLYGAIDINFDIVAAPICNYDPSSRDPLKPGVIVTNHKNYGTELVIASPGNEWTPGFEIKDGCGMSLHIEKINVTGFSGHWGPSGIVIAGAGEFEAKLLDKKNYKRKKK
ncbi:MAG: hypothetical protein GY760_11470 [Deltaproteobacteria bacterium]|nr:hypothetical protein [Deltaproteobacteria bacterium]